MGETVHPESVHERGDLGTGLPIYSSSGFEARRMSMRNRIVALLLMVVVGVLTGCSFFNPPVVPVIGPQLLFSDDFSNASSQGWWQGSDEVGEWEITNGRYYGHVDDEDSYYYVYNTTVDSLADFRVEATTGQQGTATDHSWGIILRAQDERFYAFEISADGYVLISVYTPSDWEDLYGWEASNAIRPAGQTNTIRVEARGTTFAMYVNDQYITQITDATLSSGSVGFIIETWNDANGGAWFDDLEVWTLAD
jgi:hypothetical protein